MDDCILCLHEVATGRGDVAVAHGRVSTLETIARFSAASDEAIQAHTLVAAFRAFELRVPTNPVTARRDLELAVLCARE